MSATSLSHEDLVRSVKEAIDAILGDPEAAIGASKMPGDRPQFTIISSRFSDKTQKERQDMIWPILKERLDADATRISLIFARTWEEVR